MPAGIRPSSSSALRLAQVQFFGGDGDDTFRNTSSVDSLAYGDGGNDTFYGGSGNDELHGGSGNDELQGIPATIDFTATMEATC